MHILTKEKAIDIVIDKLKALVDKQDKLSHMKFRKEFKQIAESVNMDKNELAYEILIHSIGLINIGPDDKYIFKLKDWRIILEKLEKHFIRQKINMLLDKYEERGYFLK